MANKPDRRAIIRAYKEMDDIGGVYRYVNTKTGWKSAPQATPNLKGQKSKLEFAKVMKIGQDSSADPFMDRELQEQWKEYGCECFELEVLETLKRQPEQTTKEFREDLVQLLSLWREKEE
ncbi:MAG: GIY-YIG nuclease family protein [Bacillota bacterium]